CQGFGVGALVELPPCIVPLKVTPNYRQNIRNLEGLLAELVAEGCKLGHRERLWASRQVDRDFIHIPCPRQLLQSVAKGFAALLESGSNEVVEKLRVAQGNVVPSRNQPDNGGIHFGRGAKGR